VGYVWSCTKKYIHKHTDMCNKYSCILIHLYINTCRNDINTGLVFNWSWAATRKINLHMNININVYTCIRMFMCRFSYINMCLYVYMWIYMDLCTYMDIHKYTWNTYKHVNVLCLYYVYKCMRFFQRLPSSLCKLIFI
jgi:hypothetical protein